MPAPPGSFRRSSSTPSVAARSTSASTCPSWRASTAAAPSHCAGARAPPAMPAASSRWSPPTTRRSPRSLRTATCRGSLLRRVRGLYRVDAAERLDDRGVELRAGAPAQLGERLGGVERPLIRAVGRHRVVRVAHRHDPRAERDRLAAQPVRVAVAVVVLVARAHERRDRAQRDRGAEDALADDRVPGDERPLVRVELVGLVEDRARHGDLADVVQLGGVADVLERARVEAELARDCGGEQGDVVDVRAEGGGGWARGSGWCPSSALRSTSRLCSSAERRAVAFSAYIRRSAIPSALPASSASSGTRTHPWAALTSKPSPTSPSARRPRSSVASGLPSSIGASTQNSSPPMR